MKLGLCLLLVGLLYAAAGEVTDESIAATAGHTRIIAPVANILDEHSKELPALTKLEVKPMLSTEKPIVAVNTVTTMGQADDDSENAQSTILDEDEDRINQENGLGYYWSAPFLSAPIVTTTVEEPATVFVEQPIVRRGSPGAFRGGGGGGGFRGGFGGGGGFGRGGFGRGGFGRGFGGGFGRGFGGGFGMGYGGLGYGGLGYGGLGYGGMGYGGLGYGGLGYGGGVYGTEVVPMNTGVVDVGATEIMPVGYGGLGYGGLGYGGGLYGGGYGGLGYGGFGGFGGRFGGGFGRGGFGRGGFGGGFGRGGFGGGRGRGRFRASRISRGFGLGGSRGSRASRRRFPGSAIRLGMGGAGTAVASRPFTRSAGGSGFRRDSA